jgi:AGZA family xanthine/uracil permease-like MFS transporter
MSKASGRISSYFQLEQRGTSVATEVRAGTTTFLTMAYILVVNPAILAEAGMPASDVAAATALAAGLATLLMGLWARLPFALAPGMGLNAYFVYGICVGMGVDWRVALAAVFVEGLIFLGISITGWRSRLVDAIPPSLKAAISAGIGLFLGLIGLEAAGLVVDHPATLVTLGKLATPTAALAIGGIIAAAVLLARRVRGGLLVVMAGIALVAWLADLAPAPTRWVGAPHLPAQTWLALDLGAVWSLQLIPVILALFFVDLLDTAGTLVGAGREGGFIERDGSMPASRRAFVVDAIGTSAGALLGTSTVTTYIESTTGIEEGGRSGLTAVVTAGWFFAALAFAPLFAAVPSLATAPVLVAVGALMMRAVADIDWKRLDEAVPAFLTIAVMPLSFSIAHGLVAGMASWVAMKLLLGRRREVDRGFAVVTLVLVALAVWVHG